MARNSISLWFLVFFFTSSAFAAPLADPALEKEAQIVIGGIMSPYCPGKLLRDCTSGKAAKLRDEIRTKVTAGKMAEDIIEEMKVIFGDEVLAAPEASGFGITAWAAPIAFLVLGLLLSIWWLFRKQSSEETRSAVPLSPEQEELLRKEIGD